MTEQAYPLSWPQGWPRHKGQRDSDLRFKGPTYHWDRVYRGLQEELGRIGATRIVVSTMQPIRQDGYPYAQTRAINDPGVAVYFMRKGKGMVMAQDRFHTILGNMRSLTMAIEGLRQMERHGGATMMERAFDGFTALPKPSGADWWEVMQLPRTAGRAQIRAKYTELARQRHPDRGGSDHQMAELNRARDQALQEVAA